MIAIFRVLAVALLVLLPAVAQADPWGIIQFHSYKPEYRPAVVFPPPPKDGSLRVSPYPQSKRGAAVWESDLCWRTCTGKMGWRYDDCVRTLEHPEVCRFRLDADNRLCLRDCRTRGGPMVNLAF